MACYIPVWLAVFSTHCLTWFLLIASLYCLHQYATVLLSISLSMDIQMLPGLSYYKTNKQSGAGVAGP